MRLDELLKDQTPEGAAFTRLELAVFRLNGLLVSAGDAHAAPDDLTTSRCQVMAALDIAGEPLTVAQIARNMGLTRQSVQRIVRLLTDEGLLALEPNPRHKRASLVTITDAGEARMSGARERHFAWAAQVASAFPRDRLEQATRLLESLIDCLDTDPDGRSDRVR